MTLQLSHPAWGWVVDYCVVKGSVISFTWEWSVCFLNWWIRLQLKSSVIVVLRGMFSYKEHTHVWWWGKLAEIQFSWLWKDKMAHYRPLKKKKKILSHCNLFQKLNMISFRLAETISRLRNIVNVSQFFLLGRNRRTRKGRNRRKSWHRCKFIFLSLLWNDEDLYTVVTSREKENHSLWIHLG